jgi:hypothetical protein
VTPPYDGNFTFSVRAIDNNFLVQRSNFTVQIAADLIPNSQATFSLSSSENAANIYTQLETMVLYLYKLLNNTNLLPQFDISVRLKNSVPDAWSFTLTFANASLQQSSYFYFKIWNSSLVALDVTGVQTVSLSTTTLKVWNLHALPAGSIVQVSLLLLTPALVPPATNFLPTVTVQTFYTQTVGIEGVDYTNALPLTGGALTPVAVSLV